MAPTLGSATGGHGVAPAVRGGDGRDDERPLIPVAAERSSGAVLPPFDPAILGRQQHAGRLSLLRGRLPAAYRPASLSSVPWTLVAGRTS
jgi:hypothetical protein